MSQKLCGAVRNCRIDLVREALTDPSTTLTQTDALGKTPLQICQNGVDTCRYYMEQRHPSAEAWLQKYLAILQVLTDSQKNDEVIGALNTAV